MAAVKTEMAFVAGDFCSHVRMISLAVLAAMSQAAWQISKQGYDEGCLHSPPKVIWARLVKSWMTAPTWPQFFKRWITLSTG